MGGMRKRNSMLLLEMIVAFTLMGGVIAILMSGLFDVIQAKKLIKKERHRILTEQRLKLRFGILFKNVLDVKLLPNQTDYYILYKGSIDPDPAFRGEMEALLQLTNNTLTLTSYPPEGIPRREVLSEQVKDIDIQYFDEEATEFLALFPKNKVRLMKVFINGNELPLFL